MSKVLVTQRLIQPSRQCQRQRTSENRWAWVHRYSQDGEAPLDIPIPSCLLWTGVLRCGPAWGAAGEVQIPHSSFQLLGVSRSRVFLPSSVSLPLFLSSLLPPRCPLHPTPCPPLEAIVLSGLQGRCGYLAHASRATSFAMG